MYGFIVTWYVHVYTSLALIRVMWINQIPYHSIPKSQPNLIHCVCFTPMMSKPRTHARSLLHRNARTLP